MHLRKIPAIEQLGNGSFEVSLYPSALLALFFLPPHQLLPMAEVGIRVFFLHLYQEGQLQWKK